MSYSEYVSRLRKIADVAYASAVLSWDQETYMPEQGASRRASQLSTLSGIVHEMATDPKYGELLKQLNADESLDEIRKSNIYHSLKNYNRATKLSVGFVEELSRSISEAFNAWQEAKTKNDFSIFAPKLKKLVELKRKECELIGYREHPYDALLDEYEPGLTTAKTDQLFNEVRKKLVPFVQKIFNAPRPEIKFLGKHYPKQQQWDFSIDILKKMGYDFTAGRQDISMHPFTINFGSKDVRVTTRVDENNLSDCVTGTIHEGGHALYEQGLSDENYGLPAGEAVSLGVHESQSRVWENNIGRSLEFWKGILPLARHYFPEQLKDAVAEDFFRELNVVEPSLIRINADELTYHFHIMIRFEVEKALFENKLEVDDIPSFWNRKYKEYLGIDVPSDAEGCMQDVHWSHGSFGYFPTYSIGSFMAAQFFSAACRDIPGLEQQIEQGNYTSFLNWLREKIHRHGKRWLADDLCEKVTGEKLQFSYFMEYARKKYSKLYPAINNM
ncbi:MAG: carboxypeptidase M32 [Bacteroidia bacterium]